MKFYETYDYKTKKNFWWTQRDTEGRCAEIRRNDKNTFDLLICDIYNSNHNTLQEAMDKAKTYVGEHIVNG